MTRRRSGGSRSGPVLLVVVVLIAALLFAGDRVAAQFVESRVVHRLQTEIGSAAPPKVEVEGFPFLTQLLRGSYSSVHLRATDVRPPDQQASLALFDVRLHELTTSNRFETFTAASLDGSAVVDYANAKSLSSQPIQYAPDGRVSVAVQTTLINVPVTATITGRPLVNVADQTLTLADPQVNVAGVDLPSSTSEALLTSVLKPVAITGVPYGLQVTGMTAQPDGLDVTLTGRNVTFSR